MNLKSGTAALLSAAVMVLGPLVPAMAETDASVLAGTCANCHGTDGVSPGAIPTIAGAPYEVLLAQLRAFKAGETPRTTVMTRITSGYTDEELEALARYFSEIEQ